MHLQGVIYLKIESLDKKYLEEYVDDLIDEEQDNRSERKKKGLKRSKFKKKLT